MLLFKSNPVDKTKLNCHMEDFAARCFRDSISKARIGYVANNEDDYRGSMTPELDLAREDILITPTRGKTIVR